MIRTFLDRVRRILLGPNLLAFARMPKADIHQLLSFGSDEFVFLEKTEGPRSLNGAQMMTASPSAEALKEIEILKQELAVLKEKVAVLERINYKVSTPSPNVQINHQLLG